MTRQLTRAYLARGVAGTVSMLVVRGGGICPRAI